MIDHIGIPVSDYARSKAFYEKALSPLGYTLIMEVQQTEHDAKACGLGAGGKPDFWISVGQQVAPVHLAFATRDRAIVDAFHRACMEAGGIDNGPPGPRPDYHENYYGAFVLDPDGNNIEAVCHLSEAEAEGRTKTGTKTRTKTTTKRTTGTGKRTRTRTRTKTRTKKATKRR